MIIQKQWNKYEAVILLDNYLAYLNRKITRKEAIEKTSRELRVMAHNQNIDIDEVFRNISGITFQMHSMESAYVGHTIMKPASKLFLEIVELYTNDNTEYKKILMEAERMIIGAESNKKLFFSWLSKEVSGIQFFELSKDYDVLNELSNKYNIFNGDIFDIDDLEDLKRIETLISTKGKTLLNIKQKRLMLRLVVAMRYYVIYATEKFNNASLRDDIQYEKQKKNLPEDYKQIELYSGEAQPKANVEIIDNQSKNTKSAILQHTTTNILNYEFAIDSSERKSIKKILLEKFSRGYRMGSPLELRKFKRYWEGIYGTTPEWSDDEISRYIALCGIVHEDKVYMPQKMLDDDTRMKLFSYINKSFQEGKKVIYYEALFKEFSDDFLEHCMYNAEMLKAYLTYMNDNSYYIGRNFISKEANVRVATYDEVKQCLEQKAIPMGYDEIYETLSHIPQQKIRNIIAQNSEFISNGRNECFHISIFNISEDELEDISVIIQTAIDEKQFIGGNELVGSIKKKYPYIIDQNALLSDKGLRDAIGYKLADQFSFKGNIISRKGQALSMMEVFSDFCKQRSSFSLDELKILKQELDTVIYFEAVYANSLRISKDQFVSKNNAAFLPTETDEAIDRFCFGDYIPLGRITHFGSFPDAGFQWNSFLLEHYVAMYSPSYKLVHSNYNEGVCVGAIVKKVSDIDTIDELIVDVLAKNGLPLQKEKSLQYLCDEGYLGRRSYAGIEQLLIKAKELRNQKGL